MDNEEWPFERLDIVEVAMKDNNKLSKQIRIKYY